MIGQNTRNNYFECNKRHSLQLAAQFSNMNPRFASHSPTETQKAHSSFVFMLIEK